MSTRISSLSNPPAIQEIVDEIHKKQDVDQNGPESDREAPYPVGCVFIPVLTLVIIHKRDDTRETHNEHHIHGRPLIDIRGSDTYV